LIVVIAGQSPPKTGVNALLSRQSIVFKKMDARIKSGHDEICFMKNDWQSLRG